MNEKSLSELKEAEGMRADAEMMQANEPGISTKKMRQRIKYSQGSNITPPKKKRKK